MATKKKTDPQPTETVPKTSYVPKTMTGLQDYSYWWKYAREHAKTNAKDKKPFRRGRIWA